MKKKILSALLIGFMVLGNSIPAWALEVNNMEAVYEKDSKLKNGLYTVENDALHISTNEESVARKYLNKTTGMEVVNGKIFLTLNFTGRTLMKGHTINVNGVTVEHQVIKEEGDNLTLGFNINSLKDKITISTKVFGTMPVEFKLILKEETLKLEKEYDDFDEEFPEANPESPEEPEIPEEEETPVIPPTVEKPNIPNEPEKPIIPEDTTNPQNSGKYKEGHYEITNNVISDSTIGYGAARQALSEKSYVQIENGKIYVTLGFGQTDLMSNIKVKINGQNISYNILRKNNENNTMDIKFQIPSLNSKITINAFISAIERNIDFGVTFNESSLKYMGANASARPLGTSSELNLTTLSTENKEDNEESRLLEEEISDEEIEVKEYSKKYTIENEIIQDSVIGKKMARKYLEEISHIEEIDGKLYLTLRFTGTDAMKNFKFEVNGQAVDHKVILDDKENNIMEFRFPIESVDDDIKVYIHITKVKMNIDFGVKLNKDTMTLVSEFTKPEVKEENTFSKKDIIFTAIITSIITTLGVLGIGTIVYKVKCKK